MTQKSDFKCGDWILTGGGLAGYLIQPFAHLNVAAKYERQAHRRGWASDFDPWYSDNLGGVGTGWDVFLTGYSSPTRILETTHSKRIAPRRSSKAPEWLRPGRKIEDRSGIACRIIGVRGCWALITEWELSHEYELLNWFFRHLAKDPERRYQHESPFVGIHTSDEIQDEFDLCFTRHERVLFKEALPTPRAPLQDFATRGRNFHNLDDLGV